jgi:hypothetical protein
VFLFIFSERGVHDMLTEQVDEREWYSLQEASKITGKSPAALRRLIQRRVIVNAKKEPGKNGDHWHIHRDELYSQGVHGVHDERLIVQGVHDERVEGVHMNAIDFETYDQHRREWEDRCSQLEQGIMMYRYKFEELDRQVKMLPAPLEVVNNDLKAKDAALKQKDEALARAQQILRKAKESYDQYKLSMSELKSQLAEEERVREAYRIQWELAQAELKKPWWRKLFGMK